MRRKPASKLGLFLGFGFLFVELLLLATRLEAGPIRVLVWDEQQPEPKKAYDGGFLGEAIAKHLRLRDGLEVKTANMDQPDQGLPAGTLDGVDVLNWWGHRRQGKVPASRGHSPGLHDLRDRDVGRAVPRPVSRPDDP